MQVLQTLIEDFGGEASCASLHGMLARQGLAPVLYDLQSEGMVRRELEELDRAGAVTLETTRSGNLIARVTKDGATRAHAEFEAARDKAWLMQDVVGAA